MKMRLNFNDWPLRGKLTVLLVLSAILPLAIAAIVNILEARERMLDQAGALLTARGDELVQQLDTFNRGYQLGVRKLARLPEVIEFLEKPAATQQPVRELLSILEIQPAVDPSIRGAALLDMDGVIRMTTEGPFVGTDLSYRPFVREALKRPEFTSSIYLASPRLGSFPSIAYLAQVQGPDGKPIGIAALWVRASALWDIMKAANGQAGQQSFAVLFDNNGIRIGHSYSDDLVFHPGGQLDAALIDSVTADKTFGPDTRKLLTDVMSFPEQFERARSPSPDQTLFRGLAPVNQQWNYGVGRRFETVPWTVFYMIPEASLLAPIEAMMRKNALIALAFMAAAFAIGILYAGRLARPIEALTGATMRIAGGDLSARVTDGHADEVGRLGANFNVMVERVEAQDAALRAARDELEQRVQQRTAELVSTNVKLEAEIAERARAEADVRKSEQNLETTLNSIGDAVIATDATGRVRRMNPVAERLTGWSLADAAGRPLPEVFHIINEETRQVVESPADRVLRDGLVVGLANHTVLLSRGGSEYPIADSGAPIRGPDGAINGVVLVFRDQTEERDSERLRIRSIQLEAQSLRVQEASRLKSEFLANMSHELRTPLNAIIGFTQLIYDGDVAPDAPQHKEFLGDILASAGHLLQLINDVLDLSKVEAGKLRFNPELVDLSALVGGIVSILRTTAADKAIRVETELDASLDDVVLDGARFKQVLYNYISNAIKFTPEGGRVTIRTQAQGGETFRLEVEDTGIGIAAGDIDRLFVEFQQLDESTAKRQPGTGLGLALTRRLLEAQGGTVGVRSAPGQGSTFFAIFPRRAQRVTTMAAAPSSYGGQGGAPVILVIEDEDRDRASLVRTLTEAGYSVETAATGAQALARCNESRFDAITLDLILPDSSGVDVLRGIRASEKNRDVPVIVVTVVTERGAVAGFAVHDILPKPFDSPVLLDSLQRAGVAREGAGTVLVVDDDARSLKLMAVILDQLGYPSLCTPSARLGLQAAAQSAPAAVILDLIMPEMDGFEFLDHFRQLAQCRHTPVIVWTIKDITTEERARLAVSAQGIVQKGRRAGAALAEELGELLKVRSGFVDHG
jgi:PAS domain S-box-containing protein